MSSEKSDAKKIIATNRKAHFRYFVEESLETGISLKGFEVKSLRQGRVSVEEAIVRIEDGELYLINLHIPPYPFLTAHEYEPTRRRKLLAHKSEIKKWAQAVAAQGRTLIPLEIYFKDGRAKVVIALARGKKIADKRETIKKREVERDLREKY